MDFLILINGFVPAFDRTVVHVGWDREWEVKRKNEWISKFQSALNMLVYTEYDPQV